MVCEGICCGTVEIGVCVIWFNFYVSTFVLRKFNCSRDVLGAVFPKPCPDRYL